MATSSKKIQPTLLKDVWITSGIFSGHYLWERLPQAGAKIWPSDEEVLSAYKAIQELYKKNIVGLRKGNEANTERRFIDKVFNELGFGYLNQDKIPEAERRQVPDYFLYSTTEEAGKAFELSPHKKYKLSISIAEAKRWDHNLDQPSSGKGKAQRGTYPHQQIRDYLNESEHIRWGILTNAKEWRLYFKEGRSSKFFEIDIEACIEDLQKFKYFYILFRPDAFIKDSSGRCLLDSIYDESLRFQEDVEKDLREKVFKCVEWLGHGFLSREENRLSKKDLDSIYHHSLILLYRILFVLNAEARDLLSTNPQTKYYKHYGIQRIKDKVTHEKGEFISNKTVLYDDLLALFHLINGSDEKFNRDMNIPRYNGGLFDPERYKFLEENKAGDDILSEVIYELSYRTDKSGDTHSIDYKGLGERHLGTVYEGLLEHKFSFANGKVVLQNDKGERKATGAYYTPDYIVKYIVENTLTPILKEIDERVKKEYKGDKDDSFAKEILKLNICDPAMGSGHFLVEAVQYLADEIAYHPTTQLKTPKGETEDEINYWKRKVVESCIYGVDIKELAVELAKLSLWLKTVDKSQPLNFLDHHLRCGNSLIGARINDLNYLPLSEGKHKKSEEQDEQLVLFDKSRFREDIIAVIKGFHTIEEMPSEKLSDIKAKKKTFDELMEELDRYREIANLWTSLFFGNTLEEKEKIYEDLLKDQFKYQTDMFGSDAEVTVKKKLKTGISNQIYSFVVSSLQSPDKKAQISALGSLLEKSESIARDKNFFHWELEFPEVFFNADGSPNENPGFDCVIGNPPYVRVDSLPEDDKVFWKQRFTTSVGKYDIYYLFLEYSHYLTCKGGKFGFITPNRYCTNSSGEKLRELMQSYSKELTITSVSRLPVFADAAVYPIITISDIAPKYKNKTLRFIDINNERELANPVSSYTLSDNQITSLPRHTMPINVDEKRLTLVLNFFKRSETMGQLLNIAEGLRISTSYESTKAKENDIPIIKQYQFSRYSPIMEGSYLPAGHLSKISSGRSERISNCLKPKLVFAEDALRIEATYVKDAGLCQGGVYFAAPQKEMDYSLLYFLAILNSKLLTFIFESLYSGIHMGGGFLRFRTEYLNELPIFHVSFTTPEKERKEFFKEAVKLYERSKYDDVIKWAEYELALKRTDTAHDFLAYLAEQMIELNKAKGNETKGFVKWLEREIGAEIDTLANKTAIKEYHDNDFNHLLDVLRKNRNKISVDPSSRKTQELLEKYFQKSMAVLEPLKEKIKRTDTLIDQIVYKLYGLTQGEIKLIEGSG
jgi:hypothetical protein